MALINCKECGKEMSDTLKKCPHCGYVYKKENLKNKTIEKIKANKRIVFTILLIVIIIIGGIVAYNKKIEQDKIQAEIQANTLSEDEKMIARVIMKLKKSLKNPESLQVFEIIYSKESDGLTRVIIDCSAQNGFGGSTRDRNMYLVKSDGTINYFGNDYKSDKTVTKYTSSSDKLEIAEAKVVREYWTKRENFFTANSEKIMRNLKQAE